MKVDEREDWRAEQEKRLAARAAEKAAEREGRREASRAEWQKRQEVERAAAAEAKAEREAAREATKPAPLPGTPEYILAQWNAHGRPIPDPDDPPRIVGNKRLGRDIYLLGPWFIEQVLEWQAKKHRRATAAGSLDEQMARLAREEASRGQPN